MTVRVYPNYPAVDTEIMDLDESNLVPTGAIGPIENGRDSHVAEFRYDNGDYDEFYWIASDESGKPHRIVSKPFNVIR